MSAIENALDDYQQFTQSTAVYPEALAIPYLALGLGDEAGELLEKVRYLAQYRGSRLLPELRAGIVAEAGDVMWYLAQLLGKLGASMALGDVWQASRMVTGMFDANQLDVAVMVSIQASAIQGRIKKQLRDGVDVDSPVFAAASQLLCALEALLRSVGSNLPLAVHENRAKLTDRLARGVIKGEGDQR